MDKTVKTLVIIFILIIPSYLGIVKLKHWHQKEVDAATRQAQDNCISIVKDLEMEIADLKARLVEKAPPPTPDETLTDIFGEALPLLSVGEGEIDCSAIHRQTMALFRYLDEKQYLSGLEKHMTFHDFFKINTAKAAAKPPQLSGELEDILSLLQNVTHFYRVFGKTPLLAMKKIVVNESEILEPALAVLFAWATTCRDEDSEALSSLPLETQYQYAGFFLNTFGGKSYLLRRESKIRILVTYHAIRILDMANDEQLNSVGIDIRPHIDFLFYDIVNQTGLMYKERYLSVLADLRGKYQ